MATKKRSGLPSRDKILEETRLFLKADSEAQARYLSRRKIFVPDYISSVLEGQASWLPRKGLYREAKAALQELQRQEGAIQRHIDETYNGNFDRGCIRCIELRKSVDDARLRLHGVIRQIIAEVPDEVFEKVQADNRSTGQRSGRAKSLLKLVKTAVVEKKVGNIGSVFERIQRR